MLHKWKDFTKLAGLLSSQAQTKGKYIKNTTTCTHTHTATGLTESCWLVSLSCIIILWHTTLWRSLSFCPDTCSWAIRQNRKPPSIAALFWKSPNHFKGITQRVAPTALAPSPPLADPPALQRWPLCVICFCRLRTAARWLSKRGGRRAGRRARLFVFVCVRERGESVRGEEKMQLSEWVTHRCRSQASKGPALCHLWRLKGLLLLCERACGSGFSDFLIF